MVFRRRREEEVRRLIDEHTAKVEEALKTTIETVSTYLKGEIDKAKSLAYQTHHIESEADKKRREVIQHLYEGAFLPIWRGGLVKFAEMMDKIADHAESSCDFLLCQRPQIPAEYKERILEMTKDSVACFGPLKEAVSSFFEDFSVLRAKTKEVNERESKVDVDEWKITHEIFMSELPLASKMHLRELIWHLAEISDVCQDAADCLESLAVQKSF